MVLLFLYARTDLVDARSLRGMSGRAGGSPRSNFQGEPASMARQEIPFGQPIVLFHYVHDILQFHLFGRQVQRIA
jgi:hypothetical protein